MIREVLSVDGWKLSGEHQVATLDPVCPECGGRGAVAVAPKREGDAVIVSAVERPRAICGDCKGKGRISG